MYTKQTISIIILCASFSLATLAQEPNTLVNEYNSTYEINFPEIPEYETKIDVNNIKYLSAIYTIEKDEEVIIFDEEIVSIEEGFTIQNKKESDPNEEIAEYYAVYETQYPKEIDIQSMDEEEYFLEMKEYILRLLNGKLRSYETINVNSCEGKEIIARDMRDHVYIFNLYLINNSSYLIEVKLKYMAFDKNDRIKGFLESFRLKE